MSAYNQQEFDFIERTRKILKQYEDFFNERSNKEKFEVTLLINAFVGLLILPQQEWFNKLPDESITGRTWGIDSIHIGFIKTGEIKSVKNVVTHLRNSVAHYNFTVFNNQGNQISQINFRDYSDYGMTIKTFDATIPVGILRKFLDKFSQTMTEKMRATY